MVAASVSIESRPLPDTEAADLLALDSLAYRTIGNKFASFVVFTVSGTLL